jgi:hypothetical protein
VRRGWHVADVDFCSTMAVSLPPSRNVSVRISTHYHERIEIGKGQPRPNRHARDGSRFVEHATPPHLGRPAAKEEVVLESADVYAKKTIIVSLICRA